MYSDEDQNLHQVYKTPEQLTSQSSEILAASTDVKEKVIADFDPGGRMASIYVGGTPANDTEDVYHSSTSRMFYGCMRRVRGS